MLYLFLSILCSTIILLLFKAFDKWSINTLVAIVVNYWVCVLIGILLSANSLQVGLNFSDYSWWGYAFFLGSIFVGAFYAVAYTTQQHGVVVTGIASKMSMVLPVAAAFYLYDDTLSMYKLFGLLLAICAIILTSLPSAASLNKDIRLSNLRFLFFPFLLFLIGGTIEIIFKHVQVHHLHTDIEHILFSLVLFGVAAVLGSLFLLFSAVRWGKAFNKNDLIAGILLGIPNFFSIYFLLQALEKSGLQSSVLFPVNNIGIVSLSILLAYLLYNERLRAINWLGIACALLAIVLIT